MAVIYLDSKRWGDSKRKQKNDNLLNAGIAKRQMVCKMKSICRATCACVASGAFWFSMEEIA
jgi:hypothetical protein